MVSFRVSSTVYHLILYGLAPVSPSIYFEMTRK